MTYSTTSLYRQVSAEGASYIGLLMVVLDSLAEDLRRAGIAVAANDIAARCACSNHALLLLGHLESWAGEMEEASLRTSLTAFYAYVRASILTLQSGTGDRPFHAVAMHVTELRATWQQKESQLRAAQITARRTGTAPISVTEDSSYRTSSWSA